MINYFIESTLCLTVLYAFYWLFLRSMKLLQINRFYLLMAVAFSLAIPALEISVRSTEVQAVQTWVGSTINSAQYQKIIKPASGGPDLLLIIYLTGCLVSLAFLVWRLLKIIRLIRLPKTNWRGHWLIETAQQDISSFLRYIFVPQGFDLDSEKAQISLAHEVVHLRQAHSLDLLLVSLINCLLWFNPVLYALRKSLKLQHEYIADEVVARSTGKATYSQTLIAMTLAKAGLPLTHSFSEHPIEKRLKMIETKNPSVMHKLKSISLATLLLATLFFTFSCVETKYVQVDQRGQAGEISEEQYNALVQQKVAEQKSGVASKTSVPKMIKGNVQAHESGLPLAEVSIMALPSKNETSTNDLGEYKIDLDLADTTLVFSKTGFETYHIPRGNFSVVNVALPLEEEK